MGAFPGDGRAKLANHNYTFLPRAARDRRGSAINAVCS